MGFALVRNPLRSRQTTHLAFPGNTAAPSLLLPLFTPRPPVDIETESHSSCVLSVQDSVTLLNRLPLCQLPAGTTGRVCELTGEGHFRQRVRELGLGESTLVTKVSGRSTIICQVNGNRIALSHGAASQILVERTAHR